MFSRAATFTSWSPSIAQQQTSRKLADILHSTAENQCCADCTTRLTDSIWASTTVGAFLCINCAGAHRKVGVQLSRVKSLHLDAWTDDEVLAMKGGNKKVREVYCKHLQKWIARDPTLMLQPNADAVTREKFIIAKYEHMQFTKMPHSVVDEEKGRNDSPEYPEDSLPPTIALSSSTSATAAAAVPNGSDQNQQRSPAVKPKNENQGAGKPGRIVEVSKRFLNYFVVLGRGTLVPNQNIEKSKSPIDIQFFPTILDVYPEPSNDLPLPSHIAQFAFPEGFALSQAYVPPIFFSFVLTDVSGIKLYACALKFYEELHPLEVVSLLAPHNHHHRPHYNHRRNPSGSVVIDENNNNQHSELPKWVQDLSGEMSQAPGPVFCPKCIVVTSHYPYFSAFRQFLQQIYRITLSESPMPIERYIANFVSEIPLPPPGQIQVQLTLPDCNVVISRPPKNDFPLVDFSFRPLFQVLDINNVLLVFTAVVLEFKIVLCSKHVALLTPVAETLLALLLPFSWQGAYIPVLPTSLLDVIDAPVPFVVGTHSDCLKQGVASVRGVVFVDLDHNRVLPPVDESGKTIPIPKLPERESAKLRAKLSEHVNIFDPFVAGISKIDLAYPNEEHLEPMGNFASERGQTIPLAKSVSESSLSETINSIYSMGKIIRGRKQSNSPYIGSPSSATTTASTTPRGAMSPTRCSSFASSTHGLVSASVDPVGGLTDSRYNESDTFSTERIRRAFLRFFVTLLKKYAHYLNMSPSKGTRGTDPLFDSEAFIRDNCDTVSRPFVKQLVSTQMFDRFVEDRVFNPRLPEVMFFDQSINQKLNRSLTLGKKKFDCSFLDDRSDDIQETFIAPPPSNIGLPDDGTVYRYKSFPRLKRALFGNVRKPRELYTSREQQRNVSQVDFHQRIYTMSRCINGTSPSWEATRRLIVHLQTQYRMYRTRKQFQLIKQAAIRIQRWIIARMKGYADRKRFLELRRGAITIQTSYRMYIARKLYVEKRHALQKLQLFVKGYIVYAKYKRAVRGFRRLQAQWRSSFHKRSYKTLKHQIIRVQSRVRGLLCRNKTMRWKEELFGSFRMKIFDLWGKCDVPLLHRSKFWLTFNRPDFFTLGIYLEEENRLKAYFHEIQAALEGYEYSTIPGSSANEKRDSIRSATVTAIKHIMKPKKVKDRAHVADVAVIRVEEERMQIYEALKRQTTAAARLMFYEQFGILPESKKKKRRLANLVWTKYDEAESSAQIVVTVLGPSGDYHHLPAQIDRHKQLRIRDDLAFTVNAALKSIRYTSRPDSSYLQPKDRELSELQHQVRMLASQNRRLMGELTTSQREMSRLQMELQLQQQPQLRKVTSDKSSSA